jgi:hypothetical protein
MFNLPSRASRRERRATGAIALTLIVSTPALLGDAARATECGPVPTATLTLVEVTEGGLPQTNLSVYEGRSIMLRHDGAADALLVRVEGPSFQTPVWLESYRVAPARRP